MSHRQLFLLLLLFISITLPAQVSVRGVVVDSVSGHAVEFANVTLLVNGKPQKFCRTDDKGAFSFSLAELKPSTKLQVTMMGYRKTFVPVAKAGSYTIAIPAEAFVLQEVKVQGSPATGRKDTITFDLTRYADQRDNTLKDVLKKLPGVDVAKNGTISYLGKNISRFTVEGLDLTNGRYNLLTENIKARDVKKAEVVNHDQSIKALQGKTLTDNIGMNVQLKDSARDRLSPNFAPYVMAGDPNHVGGKLNVMQIGRKRQMMYQAMYNRKGDELQAQNTVLGFFDIGASAADLPTWYTAPSLYAPIDADRLRFNTSQLYSVNHLTKRGDNELRLTTSYVRSVERQHTENSSTYFFDGDPIVTTEQQYKQLTQDNFNLELRHTINTAAVFGKTTFTADIAQQDGFSSYSTGLQQRVRTPEANLSASIYRMKTYSRSTLTWNSIVDYHYQHPDLYINDEKSNLVGNLWHTDNSLSYNIKKGALSQTYRVGIEAQNMALQGNHPMTRLSLSPSWFWDRNRLRLSFSLPLSWQRFQHEQKNIFALTPSLYTTLKQGYRGEWNVVASFSKTASQPSNFLLPAYRRNYRSWFEASGEVPVTQTLFGRLQYKYERPVYEFFWRTSVSFTRYWNDHSTDMQIRDGNYYYRLVSRHTLGDNTNLETSVSKGFNAIHLKTQLRGSLSYARGEQLSQGQLYSYRAHTYQLQPSINFAPGIFLFSYEGTFGWSHVNHAASSTLFTMQQELLVTATAGKVDLSYVIEHYRNELQEGQYQNTLLSDAKLVWRMKRLRLQALLRNIFNKKTYEETIYSGISTITNRTTLRPREFILSLQFSL